jgi:methionyl aminopeptidase
VPSAKKILKEGDLINIDVSCELDGFWADNGRSFVLGSDINNHQKLVDTSIKILHKAISQVRHGVKIAELGRFIELEAKKNGFLVIKDLVGHGVGRSLHEEPTEIPCFYDKHNKGKFQKNSVIALETFISTKATHTREMSDGWTLKTTDGSFVAQHEHTLMVTDTTPFIFTIKNGIPKL